MKNLKYDNMTCFARFKYAIDKPAFRVHIWDVFDKANLTTKNFSSMLDSIESELCEMYAEQGFDSSDEEMELDAEEADFEKASDDSANANLVEAVYKHLRFNIFDSGTEGGKAHQQDKSSSFKELEESNSEQYEQNDNYV